MRIDDRIYGSVDITEPVLVEFIETRAIQRLRHITMGGIVALLEISPPSNRFEHSLGAMILVRKLGGTIEEQAAALLHDVSHTAFSHVIDYAVDSPSNQNYHEKVKVEYVMQTEIPEICRKYNLDIERVLDEDKFSILEQPLPKLCADRIDYTLRDIAYVRKNSASDLVRVVSDLVIDNGYPAFKAIGSALEFVSWYSECSRSFWTNLQHCSLYHICGDVIRQALSEGLISENDFWLSDQKFWKKLTSAASHSTEIEKQFKAISQKTTFEVTSMEDADFVVHRKIRWIDPDVIMDGIKSPLSQVSSNYLEHIENFQQQNKEQEPVKMIF